MKLGLASLTLLLVSCSSLPSPDQVASAKTKKDAICRFVEAWAPGNPDLEKPLELCRADAELKEIAAAYAGCQAPLVVE